MAQPDRVSDAVWAHLDPGDGRPPRRSRRATLAAATIVALLIVCWYLASISGLVSPRLSIGGAWSAQFSPTDRTVSQTFTVTSGGWASVPLTGIASPTPALRVTAVDGLPTTLHSGEKVTVTVHYHVTDCAAFLDPPALTVGPMPALQVEVSHWWGTFWAPVASTPDSAAASACG